VSAGHRGLAQRAAERHGEDGAGGQILRAAFSDQLSAFSRVSPALDALGRALPPSTPRRAENRKAREAALSEIAGTTPTAPAYPRAVRRPSPRAGIRPPRLQLQYTLANYLLSQWRQCTRPQQGTLSASVPQDRFDYLTTSRIFLTSSAIPSLDLPATRSASVGERSASVAWSMSCQIGRILISGQHAFLWENGGPMVDLNTLIPAGSSLQLVFAFAINDRGEIVGAGEP